MKAGKGKILIRFSRELIERFKKDEPKYLSMDTGRIIVKDYKSFSYDIDVSNEIGEVAAVNDQQRILKPGDTVFLSYLVFVAGRYQSRANPKREPAQRLLIEPNGDEIFWCYDGTDLNDSDIYARITGEEIEMMPGYILINEPQPIRQQGHILMPEDREQSYWAVVLNVSPHDSQDFAQGDRILCRGGFYYEIKRHGGSSMYMVRPKNILAVNDVPTQ